MCLTRRVTWSWWATYLSNQQPETCGRPGRIPTSAHTLKGVLLSIKLPADWRATQQLSQAARGDRPSC